MKKIVFVVVLLSFLAVGSSESSKIPTPPSLSDPLLHKPEKEMQRDSHFYYTGGNDQWTGEYHATVREFASSSSEIHYTLVLQFNGDNRERKEMGFIEISHQSPIASTSIFKTLEDEDDMKKTFYHRGGTKGKGLLTGSEEIITNVQTELGKDTIILYPSAGGN
ncbi:hypothetical protein [Evansella tamaricis]|uniref:Uncharacterized protein n=1 Tax=Evansella tamaricis TaxID=2069301 RepID=A0ABS6JKB8_9BACI|nr:hypothetical protein [Evansella tamaricis]MBU9714137.1 hypothetical protein [Evansella tamaricis]